MSSNQKISIAGEKDQYLRDDSFAAYLAHVRQSFSNANSRHSSFSLPPPSTCSSSKDPRRELEVFNAEKYYSGTLDNYHPHPHQLNNSGRSKCYTGKTSLEKSTRSCKALVGVKFVSSSSCMGKKRGLFSIFKCYCTPKTAFVEEDEEEEDGGGDVGRCPIDAKMPPLDFRRSLEVAGRVQRCRTLSREGSSGFGVVRYHQRS